jgi:MHS family alpha-ketoglutarate permease-like MFS transporter
MMRRTCTRLTSSSKQEAGEAREFAARAAGLSARIAIVVGLTAGGTAAFYTFTTYMQTFVKQTVGLTRPDHDYVIFGSLIFACLLQPIYGAISDRIGRKPLLIFFGVAGTLLTVPILTTLQTTKSPWIAFLLICGAWVFVAGYTSINAVVKAELFPTSIRATGVACPMR